MGIDLEAHQRAAGLAGRQRIVRVLRRAAGLAQQARPALGRGLGGRFAPVQDFVRQPAVQRALRVPRSEVVAGARTESPRAELVTLLLPDRRVLLAWGVSEESIASARALGAGGTLVARVLVLAPGSDGAVTRTLTDKDAQPTGEHTIGPIAPGSFVTAAVGFRDGEQFVSVAAAPVLDVD